MNRALLLGGTVALALGSVVAGAVTELPAARAQGDATWLSSYAAAQAVARQSAKPIFLVFR